MLFSILLSTSVSDDRRSGWGEYFIDCEKRIAKRWSYQPDGSRVAEEMKPGEVVFYHRWLFDELEINGKKKKVPGTFLGDVVKIKIAIRNELTEGDRKEIKAKREEREKIFKEAQPGVEYRDEDVPHNPENMVEIGCWLKVWVRNARMKWKVEPKDDRSEWIVQSMDSTDLGVGIEVTKSGNLKVNTPFPWRNHGFLRGRIVDGRGVKAKKIPKPSELTPLYAALVTPEGSKHLNDLIQFFTAPKKTDQDGLKEIGSALVGFLGNSLVSVLVFYSIKEYLKRKGREVPDSTTTNAIFQEQQKKEIKATLKYLQGLLRFFDISNKFASFGVSGFRATTLDGLKKEAKNRPSTFSLYSTLFGTQLDMALCLHPELMEDLVNDSLDARRQALNQFLGTPSTPVGAVNQSGPFGLLLDKFKNVPTGELNPGRIDISFPLASYSKTEYFPRPFGMLVTIPFVPPIPVGFASLKFSRQAALDINFQSYWNENAVGLGFGLTLGENSGLRLGVEFCALWAILARPDYLPYRGSRAGNIRPNYNSRAAAAEVRRLESRSQAGQGASSREIQDSVLLRLVQNLQGAMNASVCLDVGLVTGGHIGWRFNYDKKKNETEFQFKALEGKDLKLDLTADLNFEIKLGFLTWSYKIGEMKLVRLTPEMFEVPLRGHIAGQTVKLKGEYAFRYKFIDIVGDYLRLLVGTEDDAMYGVAGGLSRATSSALRLRKDREFIHFGQKRKIYLEYGSKDVPKIDFNIRRSDGLNEFPQGDLDFNPNPFISESKALFVIGKDAAGREFKRLEYELAISTKALGAEYLSAGWMGKKLNNSETSFQSVRLVRSVMSSLFVAIEPEAVLFSKGRPLEKGLHLLLRSPKLVESKGQLVQSPEFGRQLHIKTKVQFFEDAGLWIRLRIRLKGIKGPVIETKEGEWFFYDFRDPSIESHDTTGLLVIDLNRFELKPGAQFSFELASFPDDECLFNGGDANTSIFTF